MANKELSAMGRIPKIQFLPLLVLFLLFHGIETTQGNAMLPRLPQKGAAFFFPKITVPPCGHKKWAEPI
jgi:hypothetical protein